MKKILLTCLTIAGLGLLIAGLAVPAFAHDTDSTGAQEDAWHSMYEACEEGDWEAMDELHEDGFNHMHHHDEGDHRHEDGDETSFGHWGGGMMMGR